MTNNCSRIFFLAVACVLIYVNNAPCQPPFDAPYAKILSTYVHAGNVEYDKLRHDPSLEKYVHSLETINPDSLPGEKARLAFWLNVYNANTLLLICKHYPIKSIKDIKDSMNGKQTQRTPWEVPFVVSLKNKMSLNNVEEYFVRMRFQDPRAHFALVCAARSCPPLRSQPYIGNKLDEQLDDQTRQFLNDGTKNTFDKQNKIAHVSRIFDWYESDFGGTNESVMRFIAKYLPSDVSQDILANLTAWKIEYSAYNWRLNGE